jgi:hypothetical protein
METTRSILKTPVAFSILMKNLPVVVTGVHMEVSGTSVRKSIMLNRRLVTLFVTSCLLITCAVCSAQRRAPGKPGGLSPEPRSQNDLQADKGELPEGFTSLFNGKDLSGWHVSKTNHHGTTPDYRVVHGLIVGTQEPIGKGGILLTDKRYKNFEVYMEVKPDWGNDSGLFLRSNEAGNAYQVTLDYLPGGSMGGIYGEGLRDVSGRTSARPEGEKEPELTPWSEVWKREAWNSVRARIEGDVPHIQVWINGTKVTDWYDTENHAADGATDGMIAIQLHFGERNIPGGFWRWRNLGVKELP